MLIDQIDNDLNIADPDEIQYDDDEDQIQE